MKAETKKQEPGTIRRRSSYNRSLRKDNRQLFSMCVPGIILLALFAYLPMFGLVLAFKNYKFNLGIFGSEWVGFKNFEFFFTSGTFGRLIRNTLGLNLLFLLCNTVITVLLALLLYEINSRHAIKAFQTVIPAVYRFMGCRVVCALRKPRRRQRHCQRNPDVLRKRNGFMVHNAKMVALHSACLLSVEEHGLRHYYLLRKSAVDRQILF